MSSARNTLFVREGRRMGRGDRSCRGTEQPRVLSRTMGRLRLYLPALAEAELRKLPGVREVKANPLTGNVLIRFDPEATSAERVLAAAGALASARPAATSGPTGQALLRAGLRGLVGHALVDTAFYAVAFTEPFGLPLAGLGALHLGLDLFVWTAALAPVLEEAAAGEASRLAAPERIAP